ncbi:MAG: glutaredoxin family protein [Tissierellia bacterium]|nr:glutaredoxin family protein [Tissierellia bacterium]
MENIKIYTSNTCPFCTMAKDYFRDKGVDFDERNIQNDPSAREELIAKGYSGVPVIVIGNEEIVGFDKARLERILDRK